MTDNGSMNDKVNKKVKKNLLRIIRLTKTFKLAKTECIFSIVPPVRGRGFDEIIDGENQ